MTEGENIMDQTRIVTLDNGYHLFTRKVNEGLVKLLCVHGGLVTTMKTLTISRLA